MSQLLTIRRCLLVLPLISIFLIFDYSNVQFSVTWTSSSFKEALGILGQNHPNVTSATPVVKLSKEPTMVLLWDKVLGANEALVEENLFDGCPPELNCVVTMNRSLLEKSDAVLIRLRFFNWNQLPKNMTRRSDQYYIMAEWESAGLPVTQYVDMSKHDGFFNLTMTYRRDSDIVWPYGDFVHIPEGQKNETEFNENMVQLEKIVKTKKKLIAWFASNCYYVTSNRGKFVDDFRKFLPVDAYGLCGNMSCGPKNLANRSPKDCLTMLTRDYKFYLALENSICTDYVTEKFFNMLTIVTIIPIVFNRKMILNMIKDEEIAQAFNKSFIAIDDFGTLEELADYLKYLDKNITAYMEYFQWKANYRVVFDRTAELPACKLCRIIKEKKQHIVPNSHKWWYGGGKCQSYSAKQVAKFSGIGKIG